MECMNHQEWGALSCSNVHDNCISPDDFQASWRADSWSEDACLNFCFNRIHACGDSDMGGGHPPIACMSVISWPYQQPADADVWFNCDVACQGAPHNSGTARSRSFSNPSCVYTCIHSCVYIYTHIYTYSCVYIYTHTYTYIYTHTHTYIYIYTHIYTYIHLALPLPPSPGRDTHIHIYTYIYTRPPCRLPCAMTLLSAMCLQQWTG